MANLHATKNSFPFVGCKGSDTVVLLKWLDFLTGLHLGDPSWSDGDRQTLQWIQDGCRAGLRFSQGIHGHGIWLKQNCVSYLRRAVQEFGNNYARLAQMSLTRGWSLFGMTPKIHALMHFRSDFDDSIRSGRPFTLNPAVYDNSMSEDFIGRIARQSRRISFRNVERTILKSYQIKAFFVINAFRKEHRM